MNHDCNRTLLRIGLAVLLCAGLSACAEVDDVLQPAKDTSASDEPEEERGEVLFAWAPLVEGDWTIEASSLTDTCGFGVGDGSVAFAIDQRGKQLTLEPPDAAGTCGSFPVYLTSSLEGTALFREVVVDGVDLDACTVAVDTEFTITFGSASFQAREDNVVTYVTGDCGGFTGSCSWSLEGVGSLCRDCGLQCVITATETRVGGPLGWTFDVDLTLLSD